MVNASQIINAALSLSLSVTAFVFVPLASIDQSDFFLFEHEMDQLL